MTVRLTIVGCSGSFPGPVSAASCYLVEAEGFRLLIDLGNGALGSLAALGATGVPGGADGEAAPTAPAGPAAADPSYRIDAICVSHLHSDHCLDLCSFAVARVYHPGGPAPRIPVYGPAGIAERMIRAQGSELPMREAFAFETLRPGTVEIGPLLVTAGHVNHPVETFCFRLEHEGRSLVYSADTGESDTLGRLAVGADLLLCEASFLEPRGPDPVSLPEGVHLTARQAAEYATRAGVGQLVLTHLVPWNDRTATLAEAAPGYAGPTCLAVPGLSFGLG
jgi:ribonuclease BN (tRNA processing enzyme)